MLFCKKCGAVISPGQTHCSVCHTPATTYTPPQPPKKKKSKLPLIIPLVVLLVAALGAGGYFLYPVLFGGGSDSSAGSDQSVAVPGQTGPGSSTESSGLYAGGYIYFSSDRVFCSAQDMEPDTAAAPLLNGSNSTDASAVCFSPDGRYACIRLSPSYSDLYRVDLSQLEDDLSSNLENATLIASTVAEAPHRSGRWHRSICDRGSGSVLF